MKRYWVYILSNRYYTVLYTGVTADLERRIKSHRNGYGSRFTKRYNVKMLLYFEEYSNLKKAKKRELVVKKYKRDWKMNLIHEMNPTKKDLFPNINELI